MKSRFYLDTNVYRHLAESADRESIALLKQNIRRLRLAAMTTVELMNGLLACRAESFGERRRAIELARETGRGGILPNHYDFLANRVFSKRVYEGRLSAQQAKRCLDVAIRYHSKEQLGSPVKVGIQRPTLKLEYVADQTRQFRRQHVERLDYYISLFRRYFASGTRTAGRSQQQVASYLRSDAWRRDYVAAICRAIGVHNLPEHDLDCLYPALQAACEFIGRIVEQSICHSYRYKEKTSDVMDEAHLHYLCDPSLTFVTDDGKLRSKISEQSRKRVINWPELEARLKSDT